jgi:RNA polymerase sigma factor (sigma-70 family)
MPLTEENAPRDLPRLARKATHPFRRIDLPPDLSQEDLESISSLEILRKARRAWSQGKLPSTRILISAAREKISRALRKSDKERHEGLQDVQEAPQDDPQDTLEEDEGLTLLGQALQSLPGDEQTAIEGKYGLPNGETKTFEEIAESLSISPQEVPGLIDKGLEHLSSFLRENASPSRGEEEGI